MSKVEPNRNVYVGHRYVPKIFGEWDNQNEYEGLSIVTHQGNSYTSKKRVPVGIDILNEEFWVVTGNYNAQVEYYRDEVRGLDTDLTSEVTRSKDIDTEHSNKIVTLTVKTDDEIARSVNKDSEHDNKISDAEQEIVKHDKKLNDLNVNVKDFGAVGNAFYYNATDGHYYTDSSLNTRSNDDTQAIQNAINSLVDGGNVFIPKGSYLITSSIIVKNYVKLIGSGNSNGVANVTSIIKNGNFDGIVLSGDYSELHDLTVRGATGNGRDGVVVKGARVKVEKVTSYNNSRDGFRIGTDDVNEVINGNTFSIKDIVSFKNGRHGLYIHHESYISNGLPNINAGVVYGGDYRENVGHGIYLNNTIDNTFYSPVIQHNEGVGLLFGEQSAGNFVYGQYAEVNKTAEVQFVEGSQRNYVHGQRSSQNTRIIGDVHANGYLGNEYNKAPVSFRHLGNHEYDSLMFANTDSNGKWSLTQPENSTHGLLTLKGTSLNSIFNVRHDGEGIIKFKVQELLIGESNKSITEFYSSLMTLSLPVIQPHSTIDFKRDVNGVDGFATAIFNPREKMPDGLTWSSYVTEENTITVRIANISDTPSEAQSVSFNYSVFNKEI